MRRPPVPVWLVCCVLALSACQSTVYRALEAVGIEKRDILVNRVSEARDSQEAAKEQFESALEQFRSVVTVEGGDLERAYDRINSEYERSRDRAQAVSDRIEAVEKVSADLFEEWQNELNEYSDPALRRESERLLRDTRSRYAALIRTMQRAERSMHPVLDVFQDHVLSLKHNLNARAIASLRSELGSIERQTSTLIEDMEKAIAEANQFIENMNKNAR